MSIDKSIISGLINQWEIDTGEHEAAKNFRACLATDWDGKLTVVLGNHTDNFPKGFLQCLGAELKKLDIRGTKSLEKITSLEHSIGLRTLKVVGLGIEELDVTPMKELEVLIAVDNIWLE